MMFKTERLARVAHAIDDEMFYQRHGFVPAADLAPPGREIVAIAEVAILATDGDLEALDRLRGMRERYLATLLDQPMAHSLSEDADAIAAQRG
ncbi:hypothetical protein [Sphingomonas sp. PB4P5]|uniref:hypothetical protein n=1 Tax=Parasphingomonas puruogangriensis TaxID=3096155 RepID=UPI002FC8AF59